MEKNFRGGNVDSCFRVETGTTVKSDKIVVIDNGLLVTNWKKWVKEFRVLTLLSY